MRRHLNPSLLFVYGAIAFCLLCVYAIIYIGNTALDIQLHDTYGVIAYPHVIMVLVLVFVLFSGIYLLFEKGLRKPMNLVAGRMHFFISFIGSLLIFFPNNYEAFAGAPRRYYDYSAWQSIKQYEGLNAFISVLVILVLIAQLLFCREHPVHPVEKEETPCHMTFTIQIDFREFLSLMFRLTYRKFIVILLSAIGLLSLAAGIGALTGIVSNSAGNAWFQVIFGLFFTGIFPLVLYGSLRKAFHANAFFRERIEFRFAEGQMSMKGTSYAFAVELDHVNKVQELKQWFVVYQRRTAVCPIPKAQLSVAEIEELRNIFKSLEHAKVNLRETGN